MHTYIHTLIYIPTMYISPHKDTHIHTHMPCTQRHTHTHIHTNILCTHIHTNMHTYVHTCHVYNKYIYTYTYTIYTYIQTYRCFIFEQDLVVFAHRNAEDDCGHVLKAVNPFLSLWPLTPDVKQSRDRTTSKNLQSHQIKWPTPWHQATTINYEEIK